MLSANYTIYLVLALTQRSIGHASVTKDEAAGPAGFSSKNQNSNFFFRHLHGDLNLDEIKNALQLLSVNGETNLMNLIGCN